MAPAPVPGRNGAKVGHREFLCICMHICRAYEAVSGKADILIHDDCLALQGTQSQAQSTSTGFQVLAPFAPRSRLSRAVISSLSSSKSYTSEFDLIRLGVTDLGSGT